MGLQDNIKLLTAAVECSIFIAPTDYGLTFDELKEVALRLGIRPGEFSDAIDSATSTDPNSRRYIPPQHYLHSLVFFTREDPEYRNPAAFDFVILALNERVREDGRQRAQLHRSVVVERAVSAGLARHDVELAVTYMLLASMLVQDQQTLHFPHYNGEMQQLPSQRYAMNHTAKAMPARARVYSHVQDVIARRTDGRPKQAEPLDAFADELDRLGVGQFKLWWVQTVGEMRKLQPTSTPVATAVLAAALVEGALTFAAKHARTNNLPAFKSKDFDREPRHWKVDDLANSAASGGPDAVLDLQNKARIDLLIRTRQRIHAGRMLAEYPAGVPDLRPEEARDAKATADAAVRAVLDWLQKQPS